jgi:hypothetical protein
MKGAIYWTDTLNRKRAEILFEQIINNYELIGIKVIEKIHSQFKEYATFENGDIWYCRAPRGDLRGIKVNLAYIPYGIEGHPLETAISTAVSQPYHGVIYY